MTALPPAAEDRVRAAFTDTLQLTAKATAALIGIDVKTLRRMTDEGVIRAIRKGALRVYTEADVRAYLTTPAPIGQERRPCPSTNPRKAASGNMTSRQKVIAFTDLRASRHAARPRP
ncbi:MAG: helix-turn-helix domain-containing protein [Caulobacter sp.]|nr:helix-turn-helix domain-containing protein [Caulobacter sp.]